jgi:hypothetical protein
VDGAASSPSSSLLLSSSNRVQITITFSSKLTLRGRRCRQSPRGPSGEQVGSFRRSVQGVNRCFDGRSSDAAIVGKRLVEDGCVEIGIMVVCWGSFCCRIKESGELTGALLD